jgi:hypothetical protein
MEYSSADDSSVGKRKRDENSSRRVMIATVLTAVLIVSLLQTFHDVS